MNSIYVSDAFHVEPRLYCVKKTNGEYNIRYCEIFKDWYIPSRGTAIIISLGKDEEKAITEWTKFRNKFNLKRVTVIKRTDKGYDLKPYYNDEKFYYKW